jgi:hypothetical protein
MPISFLWIIVSCLVLQSCTKTVFPTNTKAPVLRHPAELNGRYKNISPDTSVKNNSLWTVITKKPGPLGYKPLFNEPSAYVELIAKSERQIIARFYVDSILRAERRLKGKVSGNSFRLKKRNRYFGIPVLYMTISHYHIQFQKIDGQLLIDVADAYGGMVLIFAGGNTYDYRFNYLPD